MRNGSAYIRPNRSRPRAAARGPFGYWLANGDGALKPAGHAVKARMIAWRGHGEDVFGLAGLIESMGAA